MMNAAQILIVNCEYGRWYVVGGMWEVGNEKQGLGTGGWGDEGLPTAGACQHHSLNLSCGSRRLTNLEKEFSF